ncbi:signal peptidase I [Candidatus Curtissbacteria bacterium]|nr:signal peptidase I [Candidatus Curtissbacteria bacterium]
MKTIFSTVNYIFAIVLSAVAIIFALSAIPAFGNRALIVKSGSMEPAIKIGDLVVVQTGKSIFGNQQIIYKTGDIIAFKNAKSEKVIVTHRIAGEETRNGQTFYKTKGDANSEPDNWLVARGDILGKADTRLPYIGKLLSFVKSKYGFPLVIGLPALLVILFEAVSIYKEIRRQKSLYRQEQPTRTFAHLRIIIPIFFSVLLIQSTFAYFSDTEQSINNTFTAAASFPSIVADHIVISEVQTNGGTGGGPEKLTDKDFIELYNPTSSAINLAGYRLVKRVGSGVPTDDNIFTFTSSHSIPARGFFLWASSESPGFATSIGADVTSSQIIATANNSIAVRQGSLDSGPIIDALSWASVSGSLTEGTRFSSNLDDNQSMERKAKSTSTVSSMGSGGADEFKGNGFDNNDNETDFLLRPISQPQNSSSLTESL